DWAGLFETAESWSSQHVLYDHHRTICLCSPLACMTPRTPIRLVAKTCSNPSCSVHVAADLGTAFQTTSSSFRNSTQYPTHTTRPLQRCRRVHESVRQEENARALERLTLNLGQLGSVNTHSVFDKARTGGRRAP